MSMNFCHQMVRFELSGREVVDKTIDLDGSGRQETELTVATTTVAMWMWQPT